MCCLETAYLTAFQAPCYYHLTMTPNQKSYTTLKGEENKTTKKTNSCEMHTELCILQYLVIHTEDNKTRVYNITFFSSTCFAENK